MLKLAILIPEIGYAGAENQTLYIAKHIDKSKFHIDLLILNRGIDERKDLPDFVRILDKRKGIDIGFFINLCNLLKQLKPDILHCISFTSYIWGILAGHIAGIEKIVVSIWGEEWHLSNLQRFLARRVLNHIDALSVNSTGLLDYISKNYGFYTNNIYVLHNGVDRKKFKPLQTDKSLLSKLNVSSDEHIVGWVGNIRPEKDIETFISACEKVLDIKKNVKFMVIGEDRGKESLIEKVGKRNLSERFIITGKVFDIEKYYNIMDVFVLSSLSEGMPNALIEAQSSGIPAIATDVPGVDEILIDEKTGYIVEKRAYEEIAERVLFLLNNNDIRKRMGILATNSIPEKFEMEKMVKNYEDFYLKVYNKR